MSLHQRSSTVMTMAEVLTPGTLRRGSVGKAAFEVGLIVAGSLVVALSARLEILLPFTPVPVSGQTLGVLLVAAALGSRRGALAMAAYLAEGAAGLPVFAGGGFGLPYLLGPTAGYLWSFPVVAALVGALAERGWDRGPITAGLAMLAGNAAIYLVGLPWLALFVGPEQVLMAGLIPFVAGDVVKVVLAAALLPAAWSLIGRARTWAGAPEDREG